MVRDKYRIDAYIATGSMAIVYAATHRNGSRVALKILHKDLARDKAMAERFRREGYFANSIGHPGIVRAIDDDVTEDGCAFIVMELLEGENLDERRRRVGGRIPAPEALEIADGILEVLSAAHDHEVLHRDLKPENVYLTTKNDVKLLDFGVARFNDGRSSSDMTAVGMVLGTPDFMPPEQALGRREDVDARSDIWALGATLFTVMTGQRVHRGDDAKAKLIATARTPARPIREVMPELSRPIAAVIDRALAFDKAERWANAKAMREALREAQTAPDLPSLRDPTSDPSIPSTRRGFDAETVAKTLPRKRASSTTDEIVTVPVAPGPPSDDVFTSAPPVMRREESPGESPTFLRAPVREEPAPEPAPATKRIPTPPAFAAPAAGSLPPPTPHVPYSAPPPAAYPSTAPAPPPHAAGTPRRMSGPPAPSFPQHYGTAPMMPPQQPSTVGRSVTPPPHTSRQHAEAPPEPRRSGGAVRVLVPLFIGLAAAGGTYWFVARANRPLPPAPAVVTATAEPPPAPVTPPPVATPATSTIPQPTAADAEAPTEPGVGAAPSAPPSFAPSLFPKRMKPRPRAKPPEE